MWYNQWDGDLECLIDIIVEADDRAALGGLILAVLALGCRVLRYLM